MPSSNQNIKPIKKETSMKKITSLLSTVIAVAAIFAPVPANASQDNAIVIIDSGFSTQDISSNVLLEVCITTVRGCNNRQNVQIGVGSAGSDVQILPRFASDWNHGTEMAKQAIAVNPNVKIILIRNSWVFSNGAVLGGGPSTVEPILSWVAQNKDRYRISAVMMSRGDNGYFSSDRTISRHQAISQRYASQLSSTGLSARSIARITSELNENRNALAALPERACPASPGVKGLVSQLAMNNVATPFATGNDFNNRFVDSPACIDEAVAVAASDASGRVLPMSNVAPNTDFTVEAPNTSTATARLAGKWSLMYNGSYSSTYDLIARSGSNSDSWSVVFVR